MNNLQLIVTKGAEAFDMSELVSSISLSGRKGSAARTLNVTFLDDDGYGHGRTGLDVEQGHQCLFKWQGNELFRGMFMRQEQSKSKTLTAVAYDSAIYLANNKDTFTYTNKTASHIFKDVCKRFEIPYADVVDISYKIPELPKPQTTGWDVICDALSLTYDATGIRYYPLCEKGKMRLLRRKENLLQWVIETGVNLVDYRLHKSIEKVKTRIKLYSKEGKVLAEAKDTALEKKIGIFQDVENIRDEMTTAQLNELVKTTLDESKQPDRTLTLTALGLSEVITGIGVYVILPELDIARAYYVEEDTHTFQGNYHSMRLKLVPATDIGTETQDEKNVGANIKVGDIVTFAGGYHYVSSVAKSPTGGTRRAGKAKVKTITSLDRPHPYNIIGGRYNDVGGDSNVHGWVDADKISKE